MPTLALPKQTSRRLLYVFLVSCLIIATLMGAAIVYECTWRHCNKVHNFSPFWSIQAREEMESLQHIIANNDYACLNLYIMLNWQVLHGEQGKTKLDYTDWVDFFMWRHDMYRLLKSVAESGMLLQERAEILALVTAAYCPSLLEELVQRHGETILEIGISKITYHDVSPLYMLIAGCPYIEGSVTHASVQHRANLLQKLLNKRTEKISRKLRLHIACASSYKRENASKMYEMFINRLELTNDDLGLIAYDAFTSNNGLSLLKTVFQDDRKLKPERWNLPLMKERGVRTNDYADKVSFLERMLLNDGKDS